MKKTRAIIIAMILVIFSICLLAPVWADRGRGRDNDKKWQRSKNSRSERNYKSRYREDRQRQEKYRQDKNYVYDKRYNHNRYYPKRGHAVKELPRDYRVFKYRRSNYYFHDGIWYRPARIGFTIVMPPIGLILPLLPPFYTTIWVSGTPYY